MQEHGETLFKAFKFDSGVYYLQKAASAFYQQENWKHYFECKYYINLSYLFIERNAQRTLDSLNYDLALAKEKMGDMGSGVGEIYFGLGWYYDNVVGLDEIGEENFRQARIIWEGVYGKFHEKTAKAYTNYTQILISLKRNAEAERFLQEVLAIYNQVFPPTHKEWARLYNAAFYYYYGLRQLEKASTFAHAQYQLSNNENADMILKIRSRRNLSMIHYDLNEYELAKQYSLEELEVGESYMTAGEVASVYNNLGRFYVFLDQEKSLEYTLKARDMKRSFYGLDHPVTIGSEINYADALNDFVDPNLAIPIYQDLIQRFPNLQNAEENEIRTWSLLTTAYNNANQWQNSIKTYGVALEKYLEATNGSSKPDLRFGFIMNASTSMLLSYKELYNELGHSDILINAETQFQYLDSLINQNWKRLEYASDQQSFLSSSTKFYFAASELFFLMFQENKDLRYANQWLYSSEKSKASISYPAFSLARKMDQLDIPSEVLDLKRTIDLDIAKLENDPSGDKELLVLQKAKRDSLSQEIRMNYPSYYNEQLNQVTPTIEQLREKLQVNESLIVYMNNATDYVNKESVVIGMLINQDSIEMWRNTTENLPEKIESFVSSARDRASKVNSLELIKVLGLDSIQSSILDDKKLVFVPNNELFYLPFELLELDGKLLVKQYTIRYLQSASMMLAKPPRLKTEIVSLLAPKVSGSAVFSSGPLYSAIDEVNKIESIIGGEKLTGLSKQDILKKLKSSDIIHLATHAEVNHRSPGTSALFISDNKDSSIYAYELYHQNFKAQLVTLSACNTGVGKLQKGEGIQSLGKAFTYAGCPSIVMSLWPVSDESTTELMTYFYENLRQGFKKDEALRQAKLDYIKSADPVKAHPYYWAGFVFSGNPEPLKFEQKSWTNWIWIVAIAILVTGLIRRQTYKSSKS